MTLLPRIKVRLARTEDVQPVINDIGEDFFHEAEFDRFAEFDAERWRLNCEHRIGSGQTPFIVAEFEGRIVGFISYTLEQAFTKRPIAVAWMFYVKPSWRKLAIGRGLLSAALDMAKGDNACAFFASITPTTPAARSMVNLFRHKGFTPMGGAMQRAL